MQNTIDILSSINITVKEIAKSMAPQNGSSEAAISKLSKGNVTTNADVNPAVNVEKPNISKANIGDIVSVLNTLSPSVLSIAKISKSQINRFIKVLDAIIKSVNKLSECAKSNKNSVAQICTNDNKLIKVFASAKDASEELNIDKGSITKCCQHKRKTAGGYIWEYYSNYIK